MSHELRTPLNAIIRLTDMLITNAARFGTEKAQEPLQRVHDDLNPFRAPAREPKAGTFHRPAHGFGMKRVAEAAELILSGPTTGEQKLGEGLRELALGGNAGAPPTRRTKARGA